MSLWSIVNGLPWESIGKGVAGILGIAGFGLSLLNYFKGRDSYDAIVSVYQTKDEEFAQTFRIAIVNSGNKPFSVTEVGYHYEDVLNVPIDVKPEIRYVPFFQLGIEDPIFLQPNASATIELPLHRHTDPVVSVDVTVHTGQSFRGYVTHGDDWRTSMRFVFEVLQRYQGMFKNRVTLVGEKMLVIRPEKEETPCVVLDYYGAVSKVRVQESETPNAESRWANVAMYGVHEALPELFDFDEENDTDTPLTWKIEAGEILNDIERMRQLRKVHGIPLQAATSPALQPVQKKSDLLSRFRFTKRVS